MLKRWIAAAGALALLATGGLVAAGQAHASPSRAASTDSNPSSPPQVVIPPQYRPSLQTASSPLTNVYFTPQDENTSTTVLFLYNTQATKRNVRIRTFYTNGALTINTVVAVPASGLVRIVSDTVSTVSASWSAAVLVNFTTFSAYGIISLPPGIKAEGYVAYDPSGTYDPLTETQTIPLRFSTGAATQP